MALVYHYGFEQVDAGVEGDALHRQAGIGLHGQHEELLQALVVGDEYVAQCAAILPLLLEVALPGVLVAVVQYHGRFPGELLELALPVYLQRRRTDDQAGVGPCDGHRADGLQGLAQPRLVAQDAPLMAQGVGDAFLLVLVGLQQQAVRNVQRWHGRDVHVQLALLLLEPLDAAAVMVGHGPLGHTLHIPCVLRLHPPGFLLIEISLAGVGSHAGDAVHHLVQPGVEREPELEAIGVLGDYKWCGHGLCGCFFFLVSA